MTAWRGRPVQAGALAILCALALLFAPLQSTVVLTGEMGEERAVPCAPGGAMELEFTHSMYHVPQRETYLVREGDFLLCRVYFGDVRAALYYDAYGVYDMAANADGSYEAAGLDAPCRELRFALAHGTEYAVTVQGVRLDLNEAFPRSSHIVIRRGRASLLSTIF